MDIEGLLWREGLRRGLRAETIKTYGYAVTKFLRIVHLEPHQVNKEHIEQFILQQIKWNRAGSTINVYIHALRFFYINILGRNLCLRIPLVKIRKRLPEYLTQEEMVHFLEGIENLKHRLMIMLMYGAGFRVSEIVSLKVKDIDLSMGYGWVRNGKGGKDRMFIIPQTLKGQLQRWIIDNKLQSENWLFSGYKEDHYSDSSIRAIVEQARRNANISKQITPHSLRHSFATHLLENGYSLIEVSKLLGHSRLETTMVYAHLVDLKYTRVHSPLDTLSPSQIS